MKTLKWLDRNFEPFFMAVSFFLVCGLIFLQVVLRFLFHTGFAWGEEIARFLFVWSVFLSVPYITKNNKHVAIAVLRDIMPDKIKKSIAILVDMSIVFFACVLLISSVKNVQFTALYQDRATSVDISMNWMFMAPVAGYALMIIRALETMIWKLRRFNCSFSLFINPGGIYSNSWDICIAHGRNRAELKTLAFDPEIAAEELSLQEKSRRKKGGAMK